MSSLEIYQDAKPIWYEGTLAIIVGMIMVASITATDISFHDDYVKVIISWCHPDNQDAFCQHFREEHQLDITEQTGIGNKYWNRLAGQALELFISMFLLRMVFAYMLQIGVRKKIRVTSILIAIVWGASATTLFMTGMLDTLYYVFQGKEIPETLNWLNGAGIFTETKAWFGDPTIVDRLDLFATNALGVAILFAMVLLTAFVFKENGYRTRGIA